MAEETKPTKAEIEAILEKAREASDRAEGMFVQHRAYTQTLIEEGFSLGYKKGQEHLEEYKKEAFENGRIVGFEAGLTDELVEKRVKEAEKKGAEQERKREREEGYGCYEDQYEDGVNDGRHEEAVRADHFMFLCQKREKEIASLKEQLKEAQKQLDKEIQHNANYMKINDELKKWMQKDYDDLDREIADLLKEMDEWEKEYVKKHTKGKTPEELFAEGWWITNFSEWTSYKVGEARHRKFKKKVDGIILNMLKKGRKPVESGKGQGAQRATNSKEKSLGGVGKRIPAPTSPTNSKGRKEGD